MLNADSPRWAELEHAYGDAQQLPIHLYELLDKQYYGNDPNDVLFGCLCHQGSIYSATYAAVPHIVNALSTQPVQSQIWLFTFLGQVAVSNDAEPIPAGLDEAFVLAMEQAKSLAIEASRQKNIPTVDYSDLLSSVPALHGLKTTHYIVDRLLTADEVCGLCRECGEELSVDAETVPFSAQFVKQHPTLAPVRDVSFPDNIGIQGTTQGAKVIVQPATVPSVPWDGVISDDNSLAWLLDLANTADQRTTADKILGLFGILACPSCNIQISLWEAARRESDL